MELSTSIVCFLIPKRKTIFLIVNTYKRYLSPLSLSLSYLSMSVLKKIFITKKSQREREKEKESLLNMLLFFIILDLEQFFFFF
ncbi:hypothetical protein H8356DRAFT_1695478 [Neocallimastix lanati (nom. inval.)]|nr:hypothetical protein H8356DRAFT_1695478 [Neocallimastix sp. JGI-2020a]